MKTLEPPKITDAYGKLTPDQTAFVDTWIATASVKKALEAAGYSTNYTTYAWIWFRKPEIDAATKERIEALRGIAPDLIASQTEVLQSLTYMARESENESIRLKAWQALERHYNPSKMTGPSFSFNLKEVLDEAEKQAVTVKGPHR